MNVNEEIERLREEINLRNQQIGWLLNHKDKLEACAGGSFCNGRLDFDYLPHKEVVQIIRAIGGKWKKKKPPEAADRINYETELSGVAVRIYHGHPPPSCKLVEVEEIIPAQPARVVKVKKLVCQPDLAAVIATTREREEQQKDTNEHQNNDSTGASAPNVPQAEQAGTSPGSPDTGSEEGVPF